MNKATLIQLFSQRPHWGALLLGGIYTLGFAPLFWWPVALIAIGGLFWLIQDVTPKQAFQRGWLFGLAHHLSALYWVVNAFYAESESWAFALGVGGLSLTALSAFLALYIGAAAALFAFVKKKTPVAPLIFAALWLLLELLRSTFPFGGFPWNLSGYIFANDIYIMQLAAPLKIWGLSFAAIAVGAFLFYNRRGWGVSVLLLLSLYLHGYIQLQNLPERHNNSPAIAMVQPNIPQPHKWDVEKRHNNLAKTFGLSNSPQADILIWPETALPFILGHASWINDVVANHLAPHQTLITGIPKLGKDGGFYNSIAAFSGTGKITHIYDKNILVPFGEYMPFRAFVPQFFGPLVHGTQDYTAGHTADPITWEGLRFLPLICYEAIFPTHVARHAPKSNVLLNLTNDAWFGNSSAPHQHFAMARLRAVENRQPLIRVANTGITAVITPSGKVNYRLPQYTEGTEFFTLPLF